MGHNVIGFWLFTKVATNKFNWTGWCFFQAYVYSPEFTKSLRCCSIRGTRNSFRTYTNCKSTNCAEDDLRHANQLRLSKLEIPTNQNFRSSTEPFVGNDWSALKKYSIFLLPQGIEPQYQMKFSFIFRKIIRVEFIPLQRCSRCILQHQSIWSIYLSIHIPCCNGSQAIQAEYC